MIKMNLKPFTQYFCDMLSASISPCSGRGACSIRGDSLHPSVTGWLAIVSGLHRTLIIWNIPLFISQRSPNMPASFILISDYCYCVCMCGGMNTMAQRRSSELFVESVLSSPLCQFDGSNLGGQAVTRACACWAASLDPYCLLHHCSSCFVSLPVLHIVCWLCPSDRPFLFSTLL